MRSNAPRRGRYTAIVEKVLFDPQNPSRLLAFGGTSRGWVKHCEAQGAVWESEDGGKSWRRLGTVAATGELDADGKRAPGRIWKSGDRGKTFAPADECIKRIAHKHPNHVTHFNEIAVSPVDPNVLYVSDMSWSSGAIWLSEDGAKTWRKSADKRTIETACYAGPSVRPSPSPTRRGTAYAYNSEYVLKTTDCGKTWTDMTAYRPDSAKPGHWRGRGWNGWCSRGIVFNPFTLDSAVG